MGWIRCVMSLWTKLCQMTWCREAGSSAEIPKLYSFLANFNSNMYGETGFGIHFPFGSSRLHLSMHSVGMRANINMHVCFNDVPQGIRACNESIIIRLRMRWALPLLLQLTQQRRWLMLTFDPDCGLYDKINCCGWAGVLSIELVVRLTFQRRHKNKCMTMHWNAPKCVVRNEIKIVCNSVVRHRTLMNRSVESALLFSR